MATYNKKSEKIYSDEAVHPGELILDEMDFASLTQTQLAQKMELSIQQINDLIKGRRNISASIAVNLEKIFGIDAEYWMRYQAKFELDKYLIANKNAA